MLKYGKKPSLLFLIIIFFSCNDLIEDYGFLSDRTSGYETEIEFLAALPPAYVPLRNYAWDYFHLSEITTDEAMIPTRGVDWDDGGIWRTLHRHDWDTDHRLLRTFWESAYQGIGRTNHLLSELEATEVDFDQKTYMHAELRGLRAFYYFLLMDAFGGVPFLEGTDFGPDNLPARSSREEVYNFILDELNAIMGDLEQAPAFGRFSRGAARALKAKLFLNAGVYTGTPNWEGCIAACDEIINSGLYSLTDEYFDVFSLNNEVTGAREIIFPIRNSREYARHSRMDFHYRTLHYNQLSGPGGWNGLCTVAGFYNSFDHGNDIRASAFLEGQQYSGFDPVNGTPLNDRLGNPLIFTVSVSDLFNATESDGVRVIKYEFDPASTAPSMENSFAVFRYADVLLMKAEALNEQGSVAEAVGLINRVRARAYTEGAELDPGQFDQPALRDQILLERGHELFWEGFRRQDLIRHGRFCDLWEHKPADDNCQKRQLFPIPQYHIDINPNLTQNPGY